MNAPVRGGPSTAGRAALIIHQLVEPIEGSVPSGQWCRDHRRIVGRSGDVVHRFSTVLVRPLHNRQPCRSDRGPDGCGTIGRWTTWPRWTWWPSWSAGSGARRQRACWLCSAAGSATSTGPRKPCRTRSPAGRLTAYRTVPPGGSSPRPGARRWTGYAATPSAGRRPPGWPPNRRRRRRGRPAGHDLRLLPLRPDSSRRTSGGSSPVRRSGHGALYRGRNASEPTGGRAVSPPVGRRQDGTVLAVGTVPRASAVGAWSPWKRATSTRRATPGSPTWSDSARTAAEWNGDGQCGVAPHARDSRGRHCGGSGQEFGRPNRRAALAGDRERGLRRLAFRRGSGGRYGGGCGKRH